MNRCPTVVIRRHLLLQRWYRLWPSGARSILLSPLWWLLLLTSLAFTACGEPLSSSAPTSAPVTLPAVVQAGTPVIELTPATGYAGAYVNVRGSGWRPSAMVMIRLADNQGFSPVLATTLVDAAGQFSTGFLYPLGERWLVPGTYNIVASLSDDAIEATAPFTVAPPEGVIAPSPAPSLSATVPFTTTTDSRVTPTMSVTSVPTATLPPPATMTLTPIPTVTLATPLAVAPTPSATPGATPATTAAPPAPIVTTPSPPSGFGRGIDLIWILTGAVNRVTVGLSAGNGVFQLLPPQDLFGLAGPGIEIVTGDVNGDGFTDLIGNQKSAEGNRMVVALAQGNGLFTSLPPQDHSGRLWQGFQTLVGDVNGDGRDDLVWNETSSSHNRIYVGLSNGDGTFILPTYQDHRGAVWQGFKSFIGDVNGDGRADLIWNETRVEHNRIYVGLSNGDGSFTLPDFQDHGVPGWQGFQTLTGDSNGDGRTDLIWNETRAEHNRTYVGLARSDGTFDLLPYQERTEPGWENYQTFTGDVNGDGYTDLIWNSLAADQNRSSVGFANGDGTFTFRFFQDQMVTNWLGYQTFVGDVNGDGRADLIWSRSTGVTGAPNQIYVALSNGDGIFQLLPAQAISGSDGGQSQVRLGHLD